MQPDTTITMKKAYRGCDWIKSCVWKNKDEGRSHEKKCDVISETVLRYTGFWRKLQESILLFMGKTTRGVGAL